MRCVNRPALVWMRTPTPITGPEVNATVSRPELGSLVTTCPSPGGLGEGRPPLASLTVTDPLGDVAPDGESKATAARGASLASAGSCRLACPIQSTASSD